MSDDDYSESAALGGKLTTAMRVVSALTIASCLIVVFIYVKHETIRKKNINKVVFYITSCQIGSAIGTMIGQPRNGTSDCFAQTVLTNVFPFAHTFWTTVAAYMLYRVIHRLHPLDITSYYIQVCCWGLPVVLTFLPLTTDTFGNEDTERGWCFIRYRPGSPEWTVTFWVALNYSFLAVSVSLSILLILVSLYRVINLSQSLSDKLLIDKLTKNVSRFIWYPVLSFLCWLPEAIYDINDSLNSGEGKNGGLQNDTFFVYLAILAPISGGMWIAIAYFSTSQDAREILLSYIFCKPKEGEDASQRPSHQFKLSSDPEDYDYDERDTEMLEDALKASGVGADVTSPSPFHFQRGGTGSRNPSADDYNLEMGSQWTISSDKSVGIS